MNALYRDLIRVTEEWQHHPVDPKWRESFHLMPPVGWLNDPNGLCKFNNEYHVFYQYAPFDPEGGVKLWGHATSPDLVHWQTLPPALYPDQPFDCHGVYSGSALVEPDGLYLYYTGNVKLSGNGYDYITSGREHNTVLAYSPDGRTFQQKRLLMKNADYPSDLTCHVRDPKVWKSQHTYYMVQGARTKSDIGEVLVFQSQDRLHWDVVNRLTSKTPFGYMWECPDLFILDEQSILAVSPQGVSRKFYEQQNVYACGYFPLQGDFTGAYQLDAFQDFDYGFDFYAPQTFQDNDRRILIGWMGMPDTEPEYSNPTVAHGWQHALTVPRELTWRSGRLCQNPVKELEALHGPSRELPLQEKNVLSLPNCFDLTLTTAQPFRLTIRECGELAWDGETLTLRFLQGGYGRDTRRARLPRLDRVRVLADTSSLEVFVNGGETVMTSRYYPEPEQTGVLAEGQGRITVFEMKRP